MPKHYMSIALEVAACLAPTFMNGPAASAEPAAPLSALARLPVKEITVFKDGHTLVLHEGKMPTDARGNVEMDYLPTPVIGTFWPYSADKRAALQAVTASPHKVVVTRTALTIPELLESNPGAEVKITQTDGKTFDAKILGVPTRNSTELETIAPPNSGEALPVKATVILLKTADGTEAFPIDNIKAVAFKGDYRNTASSEEFRNLLTLKLDWANGRTDRTADVGMMYLQKGVRWIPSYKIVLDEKGGAKLSLQASIVNELADLDDVTANLVIGVPSFTFKDTVDPISLQQTFVQLSSYFADGQRTGYAFSNSIMSQMAGAGGPQGPVGQPGVHAGPEVGSSEKNEDLYVFTVKHVSLRKGQRMVMPIAEYALKYHDVYTVDLPYAPPREMRTYGSLNSDQQSELAKLMSAPKAIHTIRLINTGKYPITTAPALMLSGDRVLAQSMTSYTAVGGTLSLALTTATDIRVKKSEKETARTPNAVNWNGDNYSKVDLTGILTLTNFLDHPVDIEVTRNVLGNAGKADHDGKSVMVNVLEDDDYSARSENPVWWGWYSWPAWWSHFNGVGRLSWNVHLDAGKSADLNYNWHYFWR